MKKFSLMGLTIGAAPAGAALSGSAQEPAKVVRMVPQADLKILDPI
ncbi:MAG: hypothetical protein JWR22_3390 [Herminiimonas sp.]|nr:hypothetical protein [Herminiimonas sp.]